MDLTKRVDEFVDRATSPATLQRGAEAMAVEMRKATISVLGPDLRLSNLVGGRPVRFEAKGEHGRAVVEISGASYTIADKGRRHAPRVIRPRGRVLATPWGPRAAVRGSTSRGKHITARADDGAFDAGKRAILDQIRRG